MVMLVCNKEVMLKRGYELECSVEDRWREMWREYVCMCMCVIVCLDFIVELERRVLSLMMTRFRYIQSQVDERHQAPSILICFITSHLE